MSATAPSSPHQTLHRQKAPAPLRSRIKAMLNEGWTMQRITLESGVKGADVTAWIEGNPVDTSVEIRLAAWTEELDQPAAQRDGLQLVETTTTQKIEAILEQSRRVPTIGLIYGAAGVGKTMTALHYARVPRQRGASTYYVAATAFTHSPATFMFEVARAVLGGSINIETARGYAAYSIVGKILTVLRSGDLLIVDEAQHLDPAALDAVRIFLDQAHCGICLIGNELVFTRIGGKGRRAEFAQVSSRCGARLQIAAPDERDIDAVLESWGVKGSAERAFLHEIARGPGGLRQLANVVRQSRIVATQMKRPLDAQILRAAALMLGVTD